MAELKFLRGLLSSLPEGRSTDNFYVTTGTNDGDYRLYLGDILLAQGDVVARLVALESLMGEGGEGSVSERIETAISDLKDELTATITAETAAREAEVSGLTATVAANKTEIEGKLADAVAAIEDAAAEESALRVAAEGELSKAIEAEATTARAAEKANADAISAETAARVADVNAINATIGEVAEGTTVVEMIEAVSADAKSYSIAKVEGVELTSLGTNVKEAFKLVDEDGTKAGEYIQIYKDSALQSVSLDEQELVFTYLLVDGTTDVVRVDVSKFLAETEYADGLKVVDGVISVKRDEASEAFLTVSADGVKLSGVQNAIDTAVAAEAAIARAAEEANANAVVTEKERAMAAESGLTAAIEAEATTARAAEEANANAITAETAARVAAMSAETAARVAAEEKVLSDAKAYTDAETSARTEAMATESARVNQKIADDIAAEAAIARAAEQANAAAVVTEKERAMAAESGLTAAIEAEAAKAREEEGKLNNAITAETAAREKAISDHISATTASIDEVNTNLAAETSARTAADSALSGRLDAIEAVTVTGKDAIVVSASGATASKDVSLKLATQPAEGEAGVVLSQDADGLKATLQWGSF